MPIEACLTNAVDADRRPVDERRHSRKRGRAGRVVHHVLDLGSLLEATEHRGRRLPALPLAQFLGEPWTDIVEGHVGRREMPLALEDDELVGHLDHR